MGSGARTPVRLLQRVRVVALVLALLTLAMSPAGGAAAGDTLGEIVWTQQFGTTRYDLAYSTATDGSGLYVAGFTNLALDGQQYHHRYDAFVSKLDAQGVVRWTRQFGSSGTDQALAVSADQAGVTVVGSTDGRLPGERPAGGVDAFVARFGPSGRALWARQFGTRRDDRATAVVAAAGGAFVAGSTDGALGDRHGGPTDAFAARVDASGELSWVRQFGTGGVDEAAGLALRSGELVVVGASTAAPYGGYHGGASDGFAVALGTDGAPMWRRWFGTVGADRAFGIVARAEGLFVVGSTDGALPGETSSGGLDAFLAKLDQQGRGLWYRQFGSTSDDEAVVVAADGGGVYVAGSTSGALPDGEALGEWDGFVRRYLANGTQTWTRQLGTTDYDRVYAMSVDPTGVHLAGTTHGAFEGHVNAGDRDVFVVRVGFS